MKLSNKPVIKESIAFKYLLTLDEASVHFNVGVNRLREFTNENEEFIVWIGGKRLIKREKLEKYLDEAYSF